MACLGKMALARGERVLGPAEVWGNASPTERSLDLRFKNMVVVLVKAAV